MTQVNIVLDDAMWEDVQPGTEALVEDWLVQAGESVSKGQAVANVVLVKTSHEILSPATGVLEEIIVAEGGTLARGAALGVLRQ